MANHQLRLGEHRAHRFTDREVIRMHVIAGRFHQHLTHVRAAQFEHLLATADVDDRDVQIAQGFTQFLFGGEFFTARHDQ
ncbi:hypothetical protein D3C72_1652840 [compost metagenome]